MTEIMQKITVDPRAIQDRLERGRSTASAIISHMRALGVDVRLFGSMKKGQIDIASDIDLLVVDCGTLDHDDIADHILSVASDIPVDVVFLDEIARDARPRFMSAANEP